MKKLYKKLITGFFCSLLVIISLNLLLSQAVLSHRPHDVVSEVELSPNYNQDQTVYIVVRDNLFKSNDGGITWKRLINGLDHKSSLTSLQISEHDPKILFFATEGDGIYKSKDEGNSWQLANKGLQELNINLLSISPKKEQNLILAASKKGGLYHSNDQGNTWVKIPNFNQKITAISFISDATNSIIIGDDQGNIYQSQDQGQKWQKIARIKNSGAITIMAVSPNFNTDKTILIGTEKLGILKTQDQGKTFTEINQGLNDKYIIDLVFTPLNNGKTQVFASTWQEGFFKSEDLGDNWTQEKEGIVKDEQADQLKQSHFYDLEVPANYNENQTIFLGSFNGLFRSNDSGKLWQEKESLATRTIVSLAISPNYQNDGQVAVVNYVGFPYLTKDQGATWQASTKGLEPPRFTRKLEFDGQDPRRFFDVVFSPNYASDNTIFASTLWSKIVRSANQGKSWKIIQTPEEVRGINLVVSPNFAEDKTIYLGTQKGIIYQSTDGGKTLKFASKIDQVSGNDSPSIVISPNFKSDQTLYAASSKGIYKSVDAAKNWQLITQNTPINNSNLQLVISPNYQNDKTVLLGTNKGLFITKDEGKIWSKINIGNNIQEEHSFIEGIGISPNYQQDMTFIVSVRGHGLFKTKDGGQSFTNIGDNSLAFARMGNVPSAGNPIQFSPNYGNDQTIYGFGAAQTAIYKSTNEGNTWEVISIPTISENFEYNFLTKLNLWFYINQSKVLRVLVPFIAAIVSYFVIGFLGLEKKLSLKRFQIQILGSITIFIVLVFAFFIIL
jgi:photosystem II stability/assembly factor-like uncharacterized protein